MRNIILILVVCLISLDAFAQFNLEYVTGYGRYSLGNMRQYQDYLRSSAYPTGAEVTTSFPSYWFYGVNGKWNFNGALLGLSLTRGSTAGQIYYRDYSGFMRDDELFSYTAIRSIVAKKFLVANGKLTISIDPGLGAVFGRMDIKYSMQATNGANTQNISTTTTYKAMNPFLEPTVSLSGKFGMFGVTAFAGYHLDLSNSNFRDQDSAPLGSSQPVTMNLSGYRVGGSVGFYFSRKDTARFNRFFIGPGIGLDYGGLVGVNAMIMASENVGFFSGVGYNLITVGVNGGMRVYIKPQKARVRPYLLGMYGYNAGVLIKNAKDLDRTFYGTTLGVGIDLRVADRNFVMFGLYVPIRSGDVNKYMDNLKNQGVKITQDLFPVTIAVGYRIAVVK